VYRVNEYYRAEETSAELTREIGDFESLAAACRAADAEYAALPGGAASENVFLAVVDRSRDERVIYSVPHDPLHLQEVPEEAGP
jgi:hypothetical protein